MSGDAYDFYPCMVDDAPASIYVNLRYGAEEPPREADTHYAVVIHMQDLGTHGIGSDAEATTLEPLEGALLERAERLGLVHVGRLRHRGTWELAWYGPAGRRDALGRSSTELVPDRRVTVHADADPAWRYYRELLLPDAERLQWMDDRRLVQILADHGDLLARPRAVDHRVAFQSEGARDAFVTAIASQGFEVERITTEAPYVATARRVDPIELEHIHEVVMIVVDAAVAHGGHYDGWTSAIER